MPTSSKSKSGAAANQPRALAHARRSHWAFAFGAAAVAVLTLGGGCGRPPQVDGDNRELVIALATAVSARNSEWLESNARLIEQRHTEGSLSDEQRAGLMAIVDQARGGDWGSAEKAVFALREAQKPTAEDLQRVAERKLSPEHGRTRKSPSQQKH